jgi:hypothetical protein
MSDRSRRPAVPGSRSTQAFTSPDHREDPQMTIRQDENTTIGAAELDRIAAARLRSVRWLSDRVDDTGRPAGAEVANSWWRAPWALVVAGAPDVAASMMGWIEREALTDTGDLREAPFGVPAPGSPVYHLSPIAIAATLLGRYDTARAVNEALGRYQDPFTGGAYEYKDRTADDLQDNLKTSQLGISALAGGRRDQADGVFAWLKRNLQDQPDLPARFFTGRRNGELVTEFPDKEAFVRVVDLQAPRQAYFHPGISAAFLAGYAGQTGSVEALELGRQYLALSTGATEAQFTDTSSVQVCKFGWGAAAMHDADPTGGHLPWVKKMGAWFVDRQREDGAWAPSSFMVAEPDDLALYWKTAEHLMEMSYIELSLRASA